MSRSSTRNQSTAPSSILFENADSTVVVVDLPRSIEEAQHELEKDTAGAVGIATRRLLSAPALARPFPTPPGLPSLDGEYHAHNAGQSLAAQLAELTAMAAVEGALGALQEAGFDGPWCLPRTVSTYGGDTHGIKENEPPENNAYFIPPNALYLLGTIAARRDEFLRDAPQFDLIVLDPPWPNRSARRRRLGRKRRSSVLEDDKANEAMVTASIGEDAGYDTAYNMEALREMLEQIPVGAKLAPSTADGRGGLVAVWVTNKASCEALLTDPKRGVFRAWGVELIATWTWLKVTTHGEPVVSMNSQWRKPWERLLLARLPSGSSGGSASTGTGSTSYPTLPSHRVIVGVPDLHSRKPNLRPLLAPFISPTGGIGERCSIVGLEIFARNLTAGWWAWGNETLLFQHKSWWTVENSTTEDVETSSRDRELANTDSTK